MIDYIKSTSFISNDDAVDYIKLAMTRRDVGGGGGDDSSALFDDLLIATTRATLAIETTTPAPVQVELFHPLYPLWTYVFLFFMGIFGNILCLVVFAQKNMRKNSTFIYLSFLSIVDLFVLFLGLGDIILISYFKLAIRDKSPFFCRPLTFLIYWFTHLSSFILCSVSIDRAIATNFINFSKVFCKPHMAHKIILFNIALATVINFHNLIFMGSWKTSFDNTTTITSQADQAQANHGSNVQNLTLTSQGLNYIYNQTSINQQEVFSCESEPDTIYDRLMPLFDWIDMLAYAIIPFLVMAVCTFMITRVLYLSNRRLNKNKKPKSQAQTAAAAASNADRRKSSNAGDRKQSGAAATTSLLNNNLKKQVNARANRAKHLTYTLITLNCLFFCLVTPLLISRLTHITPGSLLMNFVYWLAYLNHSLNFILYGVSSPPFRETLFKLFHIRQNSPAVVNNQNPTTQVMSKIVTNNHKNVNEIKPPAEPRASNTHLTVGS